MTRNMTQDMKRNIQTTDYRRLRSRSVGFAARTLFACYQRDARIRQQRVSGFAIRMFLLFLMMVVGAMGAWGANQDYWFFIVNKSGKIVTYAKKTIEQTKTVSASYIPDNIKSVNATSWKFYNGDQISSSLSIVIPQITQPSNSYVVDCSSWGTVTLNSSSTPMSKFQDCESTNCTNYPNYIFVFCDYLEGSVPDLRNGIYYTMKFKGESTSSYGYYNDDTSSQRVVNSGTTSITNAQDDPKYLWCFKGALTGGVIDPYDVKIYNGSVGTGDSDYFVSNPLDSGDNGVGSGPENENNKLQPASVLSSHRISSYFVATGYDYANSGDFNVTANPAYNKADKGTVYHNLWAEHNNDATTTCGITSQNRFMRGNTARRHFASMILTRVTYTYKIVDASGNTIVQATTEDNTLEVPDVIKSPLATYTYYGTQQDAIDETSALSSPKAGATTTIYVRYTTSGSLDLNGGTSYNMLINGNFVYASSASAIGIESSIADPTDNTYKWKITGNDAYQLTLQNVNNSKYITYDVSSGEAVPTLSDTGGKFFLHEGSDGKFEVVAATTNDFSTTDYYTLGVASSTLMLYSKTNYPLGRDEIQTMFVLGYASITTAPVAASLTYNATEQSLVSVGVAEHGTMQYSLGDEEHYSAVIPTAKNVGTYEVYYKAKGSIGYFDWEPSTPISVTITKAALTVTPDAKTKVYGDEDPALTFTTSGLLGSDTEADALTGSLSRTSGQNVNEYDITQGNLTSANYDITLTSGVKLTITPAGLSITAEAKSKGYGDADPELTYTTTGLKFEDTAAGVLSGALSRATGNNVGTYAIEQGTLASNSNYTISYTGANLTITPKSLTSSDITLNITRSGNSYTVTVEDGNNTLDEGAGNDYTLGSTGDSSTKYYVATISGANNYSGSVSAKFVNVDFHSNSSNNEWTSSFVIGTSEGAFATPTGYTAHIVTGASGNTVATTSLSYIPEGVPVILLSTASSNGFMAQPTSGAAPDVTGNKLAVATGTEGERTFTAGQIYILYNGEFVLNAAGTVAAGKVYLPKSAVAGSRPAPARLFIDWGETSGIENSHLSPLTSQPSGTWYTLDGRRLNGQPAKKGLYLLEGKKMVVR